MKKILRVLLVAVLTITGAFALQDGEASAATKSTSKGGMTFNVWTDYTTYYSTTVDYKISKSSGPMVEYHSSVLYWNGSAWVSAGYQFNDDGYFTYATPVKQLSVSALRSARGNGSYKIRYFLYRDINDPSSQYGYVESAIFYIK